MVDRTWQEVLVVMVVAVTVTAVDLEVDHLELQILAVVQVLLVLAMVPMVDLELLSSDIPDIHPKYLKKSYVTTSFIR